MLELNTSKTKLFKLDFDRSIQLIYSQPNKIYQLTSKPKDQDQKISQLEEY